MTLVWYVFQLIDVSVLSVPPISPTCRDPEFFSLDGLRTELFKSIAAASLKELRSVMYHRVDAIISRRNGASAIQLTRLRELFRLLHRETELSIDCSSPESPQMFEKSVPMPAENAVSFSAITEVPDLPQQQ